VAVSVATHALLIGGAVIGTDRAAAAVLENIRESIYYLPPPDRTPSQPPLEERVRYTRAGAGAPEESVAPDSVRPLGDPRATRSRGTERGGADDVTQAAQAALSESADSVYSVLEVDIAAVRMAGSAAPVYPPALREQYIEGSVAARDVIDSTGHAEPQSLEVLEATHPEFEQSVRDALPGMRFSPGIVGGRRIRQLVEQRFAFRMVATVPSTAAEHTKAAPTP
jgi:outer membrane biosynthesis protein TonB